MKNQLMNQMNQNMTPIIYLSVKKEIPATGYWDHEFIKDIFKNIPQTNRRVVVIPGAYQYDCYDKINARLAKIEKVLVIITSDEECKFNVNKLEHPDMIVYSQYGNGGKMFPLGYSPGTRELLKSFGLVSKSQDWFFAGQITHPRREMMANELRKLNRGLLVETDGFAKGLNKEEYLFNLAISKVAPCSPGAVAIDSFRLYEALEAGAIPIVDDISPLKSSKDYYWDKLFKNIPFPVYTNPKYVSSLINTCVKDKSIARNVFIWWINWKYQFKEQLKKDLGVAENDMVVVIPVSPIPSHPSTSIIDETIKTIRVHTNATIIVTMDGVRKEQEDRLDDYNEFIRKFLWKCNFEYEDVLPVVFKNHTHQVGMMKAVLDNISAPTVLYVEQDTPLTPDRSIPLNDLIQIIKSKAVDVVRFHFEEVIPEPHKYLMLEQQGYFLKTLQWSQRPHLASTSYYRHILNTNFSENANCFIEDKMHSVVQTHHWEDNKITIFFPKGGIKRSYNLDGRKNDKKYDKEQIW